MDNFFLIQRREKCEIHYELYVLVKLEVIHSPLGHRSVRAMEALLQRACR